MKPYGIRRKDFGCCPGHDKFPRDINDSRESHRTHSEDTKILHGIARARIKTSIHRAVVEGKEDGFFDGV